MPVLTITWNQYEKFQKPNKDYKFELLYRAPIIKLKSRNVAIIGEMDKWAHFSPQRVKQINNYYEWVNIELFGAIGEEITFYTANLGLTLITFSLLK